MSTDDLIVEVKGPVLWLIINREERRNAMNVAVLQGICSGIERACNDRSIRAVVLSGAGTRAFCAGGDLQSANPFGIDYSDPYGRGADVFRKARAATVPLIARVNGACLAGGMGLMAMCDLVVADNKAVFGLPEVTLGVFPAQVLSVLQFLIPRRALNEMCLIGERISAQRALELGLVNYITDDLDRTLDEVLNKLLANSPAAIRRGLYTLKKIETMSFEESISFTESQISLFALTDDAKEGQLAFREKRKPEWTGR
ncbi:MAG: enoyl-CoA hydratase/isomerase family protein [Pseudorhodoplanes sp.]